MVELNLDKIIDKQIKGEKIVNPAAENNDLDLAQQIVADQINSEKQKKGKLTDEEEIYKLRKVITSYFGKRDLAEQILNLQPLYYDINRIWWYWNKGKFRWEIVDETDILNFVRELSTFNTVKAKEKTEILEALKQYARERKPTPIKTSWVQFKDLIVDIETGEEIKATPKYFVTNPIAWELHKERFVNTPVLDKIFEEWVGEKYVKTLYQMIAYSLLPSYPIHRLFCLIGGGMNGKCQKGDDKVLMANGKWKRIKDIKIGEKVISPQKNGNSKIVKVINTHSRFEQNVYDIYEKNKTKRLLYTCAGNHLIPIIRTWTKRTSKNDSTPRIRERKLFEYDAKHISKLNNDKSQICSFTTTAIDYNKQPDSKVNPYCLGAWLGDGHFSIRKIRKKGKDKRRHRLNNGNYVLGKGLGITTMDKEIIDEFYKNYPEDMKGISKKENNRASTYRMKVNGKFANELLNLNLKSRNKFIPQECLLSSIKYRFELLSGLIDTDGFVDKNGAIYYVTKSSQLSKDIKNLVFSLGGRTIERKIKKKSQSGYEGKYLELSIQFKNKTLIPLRLPFKKNRLKKQRYEPRNIAIECIKTKPQQVYGIELESGSKWYITNDWMVTHNSCFLRLLTKFVGKENITSTELDTLLTSRFEITRLHKKLVCVLGETNFEEISKTSILKKLTGQDMIGFEYKNKNPFTDFNYAKIFIATNNLPATTDKTIGFYRRWLIIDFPNKFSEKKDILNEIPNEEFEVLGVKCLGILKDLLNEKEFANEGTIEERMEKYEAKSNFLEKFLKLTIEEELNGYITKSDFIKKFQQWCKENRHREMSETTIGTKMKELGYESGLKHLDWMNDGKGGNARIWLGIKWKE